MGVAQGLAVSNRIITPAKQIRFPGVKPLVPSPSAANGGVVAPPPVFRQKNIYTFTQLLTTAQAVPGLLILRGGACIWYVNSTTGTDLVNVRLESQDSSAIPMSPGQSLIGFPFSRLYFDWAAQAGSTATFFISDAFADEAIRFT